MWISWAGKTWMGFYDFMEVLMGFDGGLSVESYHVGPPNSKLAVETHEYCNCKDHKP